jgi:hypothetical protein
MVLGLKVSVRREKTEESEFVIAHCWLEFVDAVEWGKCWLAFVGVVEW